MKKSAFAVLMLFASSSLLIASDLKTYKATYDKEMESIVLGHGMEISQLGQSYTKALDALLTKVKRAGDLDRSTATMDEIKRFSQEKGMPPKASQVLDIQNLQTSYTGQASVLDATKAQKVVFLTAKYDKALAGLQKSLVSSDNFDDAKAVQAERRAIEASESYTEAKALFAVHAKKKEIVLAVHAKKKMPKTLVIWNMHNGHYNDSGTEKCDILLFKGEKQVWRKKAVTIPWKANADTKVSLQLPAMLFDRVRIEITSSVGKRGGLTEIQVLQAKENLALNCKAEASSIVSTRFPANRVTDGIVTSGTWGQGYWQLPDRKLGWIDVHVK